MEEEVILKKDISFKFETGSTYEDMVKYADTIRMKLKLANYSEDVIEGIVKDYLSSISPENITVLCDSCSQEIKNFELERKIYTCEKCPMKFDLCSNCHNSSNNINICPKNFGCNKDIDSNPGIFVVKDRKEEEDSYTIFGKAYNSVKSKTINVKKEYLLSDIINIEDFSPFLFYIMDKHISHLFFADMWLHFRTTNTKCILKYGQPKSQLFEIDHKLKEIYDNLKVQFKMFLEVTNLINPDSSLMMRIIYQNKDQFIIRRVGTKEREENVDYPFVTHFVKGVESEPTEKTDDLYEYVNKTTKLNMEIEDMKKFGQLFMVVFSTNDKYFIEMHNLVKKS